jgi:hypothetical protein
LSATDAALGVFLSPEEKALVATFNEDQKAKLMLDSAMSAWSYEDLVSNQLGVQFFRSWGGYVNAGTDDADVRRRFIEKMTEFFATIQVVNDAAEVKALGAKLPGKERWTAPKMGLAQAQAKFPELFAFGNATHRVRLAVYDTEAAATQGKAFVEASVPSVGSGGKAALVVTPFGDNRRALYTSNMSHFEAVVFKHLIDKKVALGAGGSLVEPAGSSSPSPPSATTTMSGDWTTSEPGTLKLTESGGAMAGRYTARSTGTISGVREGNVVTGAWRSDDGTFGGRFQWHLAAAGGSFTGTWGNGSSTSDAGNWNGTRS